ncbi:sodium/proline symporter [Granulicatella balaenopterae]|uniref:Sodium/proline symporter n=1 Tax=Granulicatella balaenopterae TaxID=137733 RepID=A0A1H9IZR0_9LACT|nr:sodium/proline symporter [Granulicatella balaenopterae]SEQ80022.1 sodium/proline symporter [Granulicatella balaenopterae]
MELSKFMIMLAIIVYLGMMIAVGVRMSHKNNNAGDFYLGGRKLGPFVTAMSAEASDMSSWLLMGLPGLAYLSGVAEASWTAIGLAIGTYINWLVIAKRVRRYTEVAGNSITIPEFFENRFKDHSHLLLSLSAIMIVVFFVPYTASGFAACGKLFATIFGVPYLTAMLVSAVVIVLYTMLGGFLAASTTDFIQSIIMSIALLIVLTFGVQVAGGFGAIIDNAKVLPGYFSISQGYDAINKTATDFGIAQIISTLAWGLGYFGMPHVLLRFMAIESEEMLTLSRRIASTWVVISLAIGVFIGVVGYSMTKVGALEVLTGANSETIIVKIADLLSQQGIIAAILAGLILAGILASTMSTADSQLLAASSGISQNLIHNGLGIKLSVKGNMLVARGTVILIALVAVFFAKDPNSSVFRIVSFAWAGFGATFGPVMLLALFWRRMNKWGAISGLLSGGVMVFVWKYAIRPLGGFWNIYELLPAFIVAMLMIVIVSLLTNPPEQIVLDEFDLVNQKKS